jgi:hypothetical protein
MLLVFVTIEIHVLRLVDGDAHERCLKNIGRLESELFPDLPRELRWAPWPPRSSVQSRPTIWRVNSYDDIQFVAPNYVQMVMPGIPWHAIPQPTAEYRLEWPPPGGWPTSDSL